MSENKNRNKSVQKFTSRLVAGCMLAILLGYNLDLYLHTSPLFLIAFLIYVIGGSLYLLIKETGE